MYKHYREEEVAGDEHDRSLINGDCRLLVYKTCIYNNWNQEIHILIWSYGDK